MRPLFASGHPAAIGPSIAAPRFSDERKNLARRFRETIACGRHLRPVDSRNFPYGCPPGLRAESEGTPGLDRMPLCGPARVAGAFSLLSAVGWRRDRKTHG